MDVGDTAEQQGRDMLERRALWASTEDGGGIATYVRIIQQSPLWTDWNIRHVITHRSGSKAEKIRVFARGALLFVAELIRFRPGVVHLHAASDTSFIRRGVLLWISWLARVPVVVHMHGSGIQNYYENSPRAIQAVIRATLCRAGAVVALGEVWADRLRMMAPTARIPVIPNAVPLARRTSQPAPGEPVHVVFLGRIGEHKGTFRLLDAWAKLVRDPDFDTGKGKAATLSIAGDGEVERARHYVRELQLEDTVEVHGWLSGTDTGELLDRAQVLTLPSRNEGQPMAVLEAMARGMCVIASDVGGVPEMIGGGCGVVVEPYDLEAITAALRLAVHDHELRARYGAAAYARVADQFDVSIVWRQLDALYREVSRSR
jgi:glycosyltransferase involved in cell wall biosynthesis